MPGALGSRGAAAGKEAFGDAVLEGVEGDDQEPTARSQQVFSGGETFGQLLQLLVEVEPKRLEGPGRGMLGFIPLAAEHAGHDLGKLAGPRDRSIAAPRHDGAGDGAGPLFLAEDGN